MRLPIAKEGLPYLGALALFWQFTRQKNKALSFIPATLLLATAYFFRDPERSIPEGNDNVVSPADGKVVSIKEVLEPRFLKSEATKVAIFLSPLNVHINRSPISGKVTYTEYKRGSYYPAYLETASQENETNFIGIENESERVLVTQIAGILARRIVCRVEQDDSVEKGERIGMIKFGSRTELFLPKGMKIAVKEGDKVKAGESIVAYK
jgi:phosphatidylserine decarboxylase